jgi:hypothetical protein
VGNEYLDKKGCVVEGREYSKMYFILVDSFFTVYTCIFLIRLASYYGNFRMLVPPLGFGLAFTTFSNFDLITDAISMKIT